MGLDLKPHSLHYKTLLSRMNLTNTNRNDGSSHILKSDAISGCALTPPPFPCFTNTPAAFALLIHCVGVNVNEVVLTCTIYSSQALLSKYRFEVISHCLKNSIVLRLSIQL